MSAAARNCQPARTRCGSPGRGFRAYGDVRVERVRARSSSQAGLGVLASVDCRKGAGVMQFRVLGPLEIETSTGPLQLRGAKQRALLALLLMHPNQVVPRDLL